LEASSVFLKEDEKKKRKGGHKGVDILGDPVWEKKGGLNFYVGVDLGVGPEERLERKYAVLLPSPCPISQFPKGGSLCKLSVLRASPWGCLSSWE